MPLIMWRPSGATSTRAGSMPDGTCCERRPWRGRRSRASCLPETELSARPEQITPGTDVADDLKPVLARQMEIYAGFMEHTDHHIGLLLDAIEALGALEDTLVYLIIGDNGASAEGTPNGTFNEMISFNGAAEFETAEFMSERIDEFGTPSAYNHYAVGWAHAMNTPFQWTKQVASHFGGTRNGTIVHWPKGITAKGEIRQQFHHIIDVGPDHFRCRRHPGADLRQRHPADADPRRIDGLCVQRTCGRRAPRDPVLRGGLQPRDLPQGLDGGDPAQRALGLRR